MVVYFIMLLISTAMGFFALKLNGTYSIEVTKSAKILVIKKSHIFAFLSFLPLLVVSALRFQVGVDYNSYAYIFERIKLDQSVHAEVGYKILNKLVLLFTNNSQAIFAVTSVITLSLIFCGIYKYSTNPPLSIFLFVTMGYLFSSFNILRQYIAIAIIFVALNLIKENKFWRFLVLVLIAMMFHKTTIIMIPLFFLLRLRLKQSYMIIITMIGACFIPLRGVLTNMLVNTFYPQYAGTTLIQPLSAFEFAYYAVVFGLVLALCFAYKETFFKNDYNLILFNCAFYSFIIYLCLSFIPEINRIAVYIEIFIILLIPRVFKEEQNLKVRRFYYVATVILFTAFFIITVGIMQRYNVLPYTFAS